MLHWREEARTAAKRRMIEDERRDEIIKKKRLAVEVVQNDADGSEAEADKDPQETTPAEIVQLPDPKTVLNEDTGMHIFLQFQF